MAKYTYHEEHAPAEIKKNLSHISPICLDILYKRGYRTEKEMCDFILGDPSSILDSLDLKDSDKACQRLMEALERGEQIVIYQDYDADGCCAAAVALECLRFLGADAVSYVNRREVDGYGICTAGIDHIKKQYPRASLIVTVDNGIVAHEAIDYAATQGFDVVVTDHHEPGETIPAAIAVVDPKRKDEDYPFHEFCGAGVIFKVMLKLFTKLGKPLDPVLDTLDIVALATVADVVPLLGENRILVREGISLIDKEKRPFFAELRRITKAKQINAHYTIGFIYGPMINSLCRMGQNPLLATSAMVSQDLDHVINVIDTMVETNQERKDETEAETATCEKLIAQNDLEAAIVVKHHSFEEGIVGIVAGRLKSSYNRPTIVFSKENQGILKGSCRSIPEVNVKKLLDEIQADTGLLVGYGGHEMAAGVSIKESDYPAFKDEFIGRVEKLLEGFDFTEQVELDTVIPAEELTVQAVQDLRMLEPFGQGFPRPVFGLVADCDDIRFMGQEMQHVKYLDRKHGISVIWWNAGEEVRKRGSKLRNKFIGYPELNFFNDSVTVQFVVRD